jgi:hypothetical protein
VHGTQHHPCLLIRRAAARYFFLPWMSYPTVDTGMELTKKMLAATRRRGE